MGNCSNSGKTARESSIYEHKVINQLTNDIEVLKDKLLFNQALLKMGMLSRILKRRANQFSSTSELERIMQLQIEMGRINQDIVMDHIKASICLETALEISVFIYGQENEIKSRVIQPLLSVSKVVLDETAISLKPKIAMEEQQQQAQGVKLSLQQLDQVPKFFQRSSTHATTRVSGIQAPSLNIILEEADEQEEEGHKKRRFESSIVHIIKQ